MFGPKIRIRKDLYEQLRARAEELGYSSVDEFIVHVLEKEVAQQNRGEDDEETIRQRLQGLGYLD